MKSCFELNYFIILTVIFYRGSTKETKSITKADKSLITKYKTICLSTRQPLQQSFSNIKGIVHPKMTILSSFTHPQVVPHLWVYFFCWTQKKIF